jgi:peptide/nickel transport system permease protein
MVRYLLGRLIGLLGVLAAISLITFLLMHAAPGGPYDEEMLAKGFTAEEVKQEILIKYGLDRPIWEQYGIYVWRLLHLDLGRSFVLSAETVGQLIRRTWRVSIQLGLMTAAVSFVAGLALGLLAALKQNTWVDYLASFLAVGTYVTPSFVIAVGLILLFAVWRNWLPTGGWTSPKHWVLPVLAYSAGPMATVARYTRSSVVEVMGMDYVRTARSKGLKESRVILVHVLKNALIPLLTIAGPLVTTLITGSLFIETIFRIPGLGQIFVKGVVWRDYPVIMGTTLLLAALVSIMCLLTDLAYMWADPRIRFVRDQTR